MLLAAVAAHGEEGDARWYFRIDNDAAFGTDRWYTSGVRIARVKDDVEWSLAQEVFTPDTKNWHPGKLDRAPTARLLAARARHFYGDDYFQTVEVELGVRGPIALGNQTLQMVHHVITAPHTDWSRQLDNQFDAHLAAVRSQSFFDFAKVHFGAVAGTQLAYAHVGLELRAGDTTLAAWPLRFAATPPFPVGNPVCNWSAYAGVSGRAIGRDKLIGRNYDPFGPELKRRDTMGRVAAGFSYRPRWGVVAVDLVSDSQEFQGQGKPQRFGSLTIQIPF